MRKLFDFVLGVVVFLSATAYMPGKGSDTAQEIVFRIGIVALLIISFSLKPIRFIVNKWLNIILGTCFVLTLFLPAQQQTVALNPFINVLLGVMLFYIIANHANRETIINAFYWVVGINLVMVILQALHMDPIFQRTGLYTGNELRTDMTGLFEYRYALGVYMGVLTPFLLMSKRKVFGVASGILAICSTSFMAVGVMIVSLIIMIRKTKLFIPVVAIGLILILIAGCFLYSDDIKYKISTRVEVYNRTLSCIMQKPIGYGLGCFKYIGPALFKESKYGTIVDAWSDFLERPMEIGLVFFALFFFLCRDTYIRGGIILVGIPLNMMFHSCFNHVALAFLFIILLDLWEMKTYDEKANNNM